MGIAKYFSKDLLAINQLLKNNNNQLEAILLETEIGIVFDENAIHSYEGNKSLDLLIRILARLYPNISIIDLSSQNSNKVLELKKIAFEINSNIIINSELTKLNVLIILGETNNIPDTNCKKLYIGSNNWNAKFSQNNIQTFANSNNPFGCGVAACIAAANTFKIIFQEFLFQKELDSEIEFSTINQSVINILDNPTFDEVVFKDVAFVGIGAIGNGAIWALSNISTLSGKMDIIDNEKLSLSNLQRYVMFDEKEINQSKVGLAINKFNNKRFNINSFKMTWGEYLEKRNNWSVDTVAIAIDNKKDRIGIQSTLPKKIFNSYTEVNLIGIARHLDMESSACSACGYMPTQKALNYINEVANNCNIPALFNMVKDYMNLNLAVNISVNNTGSMLDFIADANNIDRNSLKQFHGKKVAEFYSEFICGGMVLKLTKENKIEGVDAPLAFQSAMAGILLAGELVIDSCNLRKVPISQQSHLYPLNKIGANNPFNHKLKKDDTGKCICNDQDYINQYKHKWGL